VRQARTVGVSIARPPQAVRAFVLDAANLPRWVPAFCRSARPAADGWEVETPAGERLLFRFAAPDAPAALGVLDHTVRTAAGEHVHVPMRVVPNEGGSEVLLTVFRAAGASDEAFDADLSLVGRDLARLREVLEGGANAE
jgi:hypothetical protein